MGLNPASLLLIGAGVALIGAGLARLAADEHRHDLRPVYVVALGDSLTSHGGYCESLQLLLPPGSQVSCIGWEGAGTETIAQNTKPGMLAMADDVIVLAGVNDLASGRGVQATVEGLERIYQKARSAGARVIAVELTPWSGHQRGQHLQTETMQVNAWLDMSPSVEIVVGTSPLGPDGRLRSDFNAADGLHLNAAGHAELGRLIFEGAYRND